MKSVDVDTVALIGITVCVVSIVLIGVWQITSHDITKQDLISEAIEDGWTQEELSKLNKLLQQYGSTEDGEE